MTEGTESSSSEGADENTGQPEEVEITKATDEDLSQFMDRFKAGEFDESATEEPVKEVVAEKKVEGTKPGVSEETQEQEEKITLTRRDLEALQQKVEQQEKQRQQQEKFIAQRGTEIGDLKKQLRAAKTQLQSTLDDKFHESPGAALQDAERIKDLDRGLQQLDHEEKLLNHVHTAFDVVSKNVDLEQINVEDVAATLQADGFSEKQIADFFQNPYAAAQGETLIQLFKRADERKKSMKFQDALAQIVPFTRKLIKENEEMRGKPAQLLSMVDKALRQGPPVTSANGTTSGKRGIADVDVTKLSDTELNELSKTLN